LPPGFTFIGGLPLWLENQRPAALLLISPPLHLLVQRPTRFSLPGSTGIDEVLPATILFSILPLRDSSSTTTCYIDWSALTSGKGCARPVGKPALYARKFDLARRPGIRYPDHS
jgi:hypothetical protein